MNGRQSPFSAVAGTVMVPFLAYQKLTDPPARPYFDGDIFGPHAMA